MAGIIIREKFGESIAAKVKVAWNELASLEKQIEEKEKNNEECDDLYDKAFEIEDALSNETGIWMQTDVVMVAGEPI
jgi:flagellar hook-associated protein FlgK